MSMRSELNKYDQAYIRDASFLRAEASFLDRLSMNMFEQLKSRKSRSEMNLDKIVNFEEWQKEFLKLNRLKKESRQRYNIPEGLKTGRELPCSFCL